MEIGDICTSAELNMKLCLSLANWHLGDSTYIFVEIACCHVSDKLLAKEILPQKSEQKTQLMPCEIFAQLFGGRISFGKSF